MGNLDVNKKIVSKIYLRKLDVMMWIGLILFTIKSTLSTREYGRSNLPPCSVKGWKYLDNVAGYGLPLKESTS
jgi:hypothetical protein